MTTALIYEITGFIIATLLGIIGFIGNKAIQDFKARFASMEASFNSVVNCIKQLEKRVDESSFNNKTTELALREVQQRIEQRFTNNTDQILDIQKRVTSVEGRMITIEKHCMLTKHVHNKIHPDEIIEI